MLRYLYVSTAWRRVSVFLVAVGLGVVKVLVQTLTVVSSCGTCGTCNLDNSQEEQYQPRSTPVTARADYRTRLTNNCLCAAK